VIAKFERSLQRPLHHIICLLHLLEVILKAIICFYYGNNIVKYKHIGEINDDLNNCHNYDIHTFEKMELANMTKTDKLFDSTTLNSDQKYLYDMAKAVNDDNVDKCLAARKPGDIAGPRWTTLASRFLRLYVSTKAPSFNMISVVRFIQNIYVPLMFEIKHHPEWIYGSQHLFNILIFSQRLGKEMFDVVKDRVAYNSYFAHPENILLCMICDKNKDVRRAAYDTIHSIRSQTNQQQHPRNVRIFKKPKINIEPNRLEGRTNFRTTIHNESNN
jgi:hypothetical protein